MLEMDRERRRGGSPECSDNCNNCVLDALTRCLLAGVFGARSSTRFRRRIFCSFPPPISLMRVSGRGYSSPHFLKEIQHDRDVILRLTVLWIIGG